jgi:hypothetical protein
MHRQIADNQSNVQLFARTPPTWRLSCVAAVNDAPTFTKGPATATVNESSGAYSSPWATNVSPGPGETDQTVTFAAECTNTALFSVQPKFSPTGLLSFTVAAGASGSSVCSVTLADSPGATSAPEQVTVVVTAGEHY